jgi:nucleotide-binding universal stress UspA family protein
MNTNEEAMQSAHQPPATHDDIVVGIDESPASAAALRWAAQHSRATGVPLRLVHAWQLSATGSEAHASGAAYVEAVAADSRARATRWVLDTLGVALSHGARLVVVGTHEHTGLRRALSGSVSHYVLSHTGVPLVAVPAPVGQTPGGADRDAMVIGPLY